LAFAAAIGCGAAGLHAPHTAHGVGVRHVNEDATLTEQSEIADRLLDLSGRAGDDLFAPRAERPAPAYRAHGRELTFTALASAPRSGDRPSTIRRRS
jgi:hypothetical protein